MDFTLTDIYGQEKGPLEHCGVNMVLGTDNDFQITIQNSLYDKERHGKNCRFFCPDTEYGGLIRNTNPITSDKTVKLKSTCNQSIQEHICLFEWRGE